MPFIMDRQGQKLNNFSRVNLSYFSRDNEWEDFQLMIRKPVEGILSWHDDAISEIFNISNGNPYFAKIVCAGVTGNAVKERDTDITYDEVKLATDRELSSLGANSFAHLWQDGIPKPSSEREPDILRRSRVLVAAARCVRQVIPLSTTNVYLNRAFSSLTEAEVVAVLRDFEQRYVLKEEGGEYIFVLPIFGAWLADIGVQQLISDRLSEELVSLVLDEENSAAILSEEVVELAKGWHTYRGLKIGSDEIKAWYQQVENPRDQRLLFSILQRAKVSSEAHIRERLRESFEILRPSISVYVTRSRNARRDDIIVTYVDGQAKSGSTYASLYAEENKISSASVLSPNTFQEEFRKREELVESISAVVIIDDIAATGDSLSGNVQKFIDNNLECLRSVKVMVNTIVSTKRAQDRILQSISKIDNVDVDFRTCEVLAEKHFALPEDRSGFKGVDDWERAKALCIDIGSKIDKRRPLGYGEMGLLVVFPTNVPNNTLPLLRSYSRTSSKSAWKPLFERVNH